MDTEALNRRARKKCRRAIDIFEFVRGNSAGKALLVAAVDIQSSEAGCRRCREIQSPRCAEDTYHFVTRVLPKGASVHVGA